ncbi:MAG: hypothetical protein U9P38_04975 [Campylobacterota bacterium]|nr:hypothetical protein [Campylobacterota bacterium]
MIEKIILISLIVVGSYANSCWTTNEVADIAQDSWDETVFSVKDSVTCEPISNATVTVGPFKLKSDVYGQIKVPNPPEDMDKNGVPLQFKKSGYITSNEKVMVFAGSYWNNLFLMSKSLPINSARFVLSWDTKPKDLDLHLKSNSYHISYRKTRDIANTAKLDRDARKGFGPETITVDRLNKNDTYKVIVHKFSSDGDINSKGKVRVYLNNKLDNVVILPNSRAKCIQVATIRDNRVEYITKELSNSECK